MVVNILDVVPLPRLVRGIYNNPSSRALCAGSRFLIISPGSRGRSREQVVGAGRRYQWLPIIIQLLIVLGISSAYAETIDRYPFPSNTQQQQFQSLVKELRCLVCQNQDLADSNADLARDLRQQVYDMVISGKTDAEIKQYLTVRYGDFILFRPPFNGETWLLWLLPFILLAGGGVIVWRLRT